MNSTLSPLLAALLLSLAAPVLAADAPKLPPGEKAAKERLNSSPRHGEMVDVAAADGTKLKAYVVYPESKDKAPVVIVVQEIFGLSDWIRSVADQLAAEGFIAIAPDLLSGKGPKGGGTEAFADRDAVMQAVRNLKAPEVDKMLNATRDYATKLPSATGKYGAVGFCWGGGTVFRYATVDPNLGAAVVYYGTSPATESLASIKAPVQGHYGGNDNRVDATIPPAEKKMKELGKPFDPHIYEGAGHGFLRQQDGQNGANQKAADQAWPATVKFLKDNTK